MAVTGSRKFGEQVLMFLDKKVSVETSEGRMYKGRLEAIDGDLNLILRDVEGIDSSHVIINGSFVKEVQVIERPLDVHALADRLGKVFPGLVRVKDDIATIIIMDKIKVTERGVEGGGLAAEKAKAIFDEFVKETRK